VAAGEGQPLLIVASGLETKLSSRIGLALDHATADCSFFTKAQQICQVVESVFPVFPGHSEHKQKANYWIRCSPHKTSMRDRTSKVGLTV
jgi:hypothetical protein